jgi:DNA-binding CsgD family transcriptional regulator
VLAEVGTGATNEEIAARLLSGATARTHVSRVTSSLGGIGRSWW